mgnify:CR=1 FL=1
MSCLYRLLSDITTLTRLEIESLFGYVENPVTLIDSFPNLKHLIIKEVDSGYRQIEMILKLTKNLTNLTINMTSVEIDIDIFLKLEDLITSSLPYLKTFKFIFQ